MAYPSGSQLVVTPIPTAMAVPMTAIAPVLPLGMAADTDDDNDGILDTADGYPLWLQLVVTPIPTAMAVPMTATAPVLP